MKRLRKPDKRALLLLLSRPRKNSAPLKSGGKSGGSATLYGKCFTPRSRRSRWGRGKAMSKQTKRPKVTLKEAVKDTTSSGGTSNTALFHTCLLWYLARLDWTMKSCFAVNPRSRGSYET